MLDGVAYELTVRVDYVRKQSMSSLLFSLAQATLIAEHKGEAVEQVHCHLTGDGDYMGVSIVDPGTGHGVEAAADAA